MRSGKVYSAGDVILAQVQFVDSFQIKKRPAVILYEEKSNYVIAGITSNTAVDGIALHVKDGAMKNSVIKTNYIFTVSSYMIAKKLFSLKAAKKQEIFSTIEQSMKQLLD